MSKIKQLLRLHKQGASKKAIARNLEISKNTVKLYLAKLANIDQPVGSLLLLDDHELEAKFHGGNPAYKDERFGYFKTQLQYLTAELNRTGVNKMLLWEEYLLQQPDGYSYSQFCFHLSQHLIAKKPSMVLQHKPGEKLFIDFAGKKLSYTDPSTGEVMECQVFVACLPYSDYSFVMAIPTQNIADFIHALICCFAFLGGVPQVLVPDNFKAAIVKADPYEPDVNKALEDLANHYQVSVVPARPAKPKDKALVENQVKLAYSRIYAKLRNMQFFSLHDLNKAIIERVVAHNQTRMQNRPYCRQERFLAEEKPLLGELPGEPYELKYYKYYKVAKNNHFLLAPDQHYYSVPYQHIGQKVKVIFTRSMVRVFCNGKQVALHQRDYRKNAYTTVKEHLCSEHRHYLDRSPGYYMGKAGERSTALLRLTQLVFEQQRYPEQLYRTCDGLLALQRKTDPLIFNKACELAVEHQNYSYKFVLNIIQNNMTACAPEGETHTALPLHSNIRGKGHYEQLTLNFK